MAGRRGDRLHLNQPPASLGPLRYRYFLLFLVAVVLLAISEGEFYDSLDYYDKFAPSAPKPPSYAVFAFYTTLSLILFSFIVLALLGDSNSKVNWKGLFVGSFAVLWYVSLYPILWFLKNAMNDITCSEHPNSISGHYFFHVYYILTVIYAAVHLKRDSRDLSNFVSPTLFKKLGSGQLKMSSLIFVLSWVGIVASSAYTLKNTWTYGFHSGQQILYGSLFALVGHLILTLFLEPLNIAHKERMLRIATAEQPSIRLFLLLAAVGTLVLSWTSVVFLGYDLPYSIYEIAAIGAVLAAFVAASRKEL